MWSNKSAPPDVVNVHVFSDQASFIPKVLDHYRKFGKPMWVTEFACINFSKNKKCSKEETVQFIYEAVKIFEVCEAKLCVPFPCSPTLPDGRMTRM